MSCIAEKIYFMKKSMTGKDFAGLLMMRRNSRCMCMSAGKGKIRLWQPLIFLKKSRNVS